MTKAEPEDPTRKIESVEWKAPPIPPQYNWPVIAAMLRQRPMEWALVFEQGRASMVNAIRQGNVGDVHPNLGFEVKTTNNVRGHPRTCDLYMRYNPSTEKDLRRAIRESRKP